MAEAYIIDTVRSPVGRRGGGLSQVHPADLGAHALGALMDRTGVDPAAVEDVVFGCLDTIGPQAGDVARTAWLAAGLPEEVPGVTVDRQCGSSQQAVHFAAQAVMSGTQDLVVAGGVQNMSIIPISSAMIVAEQFGFTDPFSGSEGWVNRYGDAEVSQFNGAEMIARDWDISREAMEDFAIECHDRAIRAAGRGPIRRRDRPLRRRHPGRRPSRAERREDPFAARARGRRAPHRGGRIADLRRCRQRCSSRPSVPSSSTACPHERRIHHLSVRGEDPIRMLSAPIPATRYALDRAGMSLDDIDLIEINEAFASVVLAWAKDLDVDLAKVNVNGGAIALGHPLGATGVRLMTTLLNELERTGGRYGLQTMCEGGGQANVTIIERL